MPQHFEEKTLPFTPAQMFDLVADIESYPAFLPWCLKAQLLTKNPSNVTAELTVGYKAFRERFTSDVTLEAPDRITVAYAKGPLSRLSNEWRFAPDGATGCKISFFVDFAFRSSLLNVMMEAFFDRAFRQMVCAFEERAKKVYG